MNEAKARSTDQLERTLGSLLKTGVAVAALVVFIGGMLYLSRHGASLPDYQMFQEQPARLRSISGIVTDALSLRSRAAIQLGLLLLVATPVARVAVAFFAFVRQRDPFYSLMTLVVLALLLYNFTGLHP